jgi:hypothetical protein
MNANNNNDTHPHIRRACKMLRLSLTTLLQAHGHRSGRMAGQSLSLTKAKKKKKKDNDLLLSRGTAHCPSSLRTRYLKQNPFYIYIYRTVAVCFLAVYRILYFKSFFLSFPLPSFLLFLSSLVVFRVFSLSEVRLSIANCLLLQRSSREFSTPPP